MSEDVSFFDTGTIDIESSVSDHKATYIFVKTNIYYNKAYTRNIWFYKHADKLKTLISDSDWHKLVMEATDVNHAVKNFTSTFLGHVSECILE